MRRPRSTAPRRAASYGPRVTGKLIVCATPLGNLGDVSDRLREALSEADVIFAEDTRRSRRLTELLEVDTPMRSYFAGNERTRNDELDRLLAEGQTVALMTDAGTPVVSDPGASAVDAARAAGAIVTVVPGPSAVTGALAVAGMNADRFVFEGFLPKRGRERSDRLHEIAREQRTIVLFVAPHRLLDDLESLVERLGPDRSVCVVRELTKMHEEVAWSTLGEALEEWSERGARGEYTLVIEGSEPPTHDIDEAVAMARDLIEEGMSTSRAARQAAGELGLPRREIYDRLIR